MCSLEPVSNSEIKNIWYLDSNSWHSWVNRVRTRDSITKLGAPPKSVTVIVVNGQLTSSIMLTEYHIGVVGAVLID